MLRGQLGNGALLHLLKQDEPITPSLRLHGRPYQPMCRRHQSTVALFVGFFIGPPSVVRWHTAALLLLRVANEISEAAIVQQPDGFVTLFMRDLRQTFTGRTAPASLRTITSTYPDPRIHDAIHHSVAIAHLHVAFLTSLFPNRPYRRSGNGKVTRMLQDLRWIRFVARRIADRLLVDEGGIRLSQPAIMRLDPSP